ncbi:hypothetical protein [Nitratireductor soli]|uniref:hypothetical protein n=1 Tax=Nitratireductor soli TaxID=1670619 RepID=UPI00065E1C90|nr:hypothetical protein [Nitratireductor soli]
MRILLLIAAGFSAALTHASAQSMTPMRGEVTSFGGAFAVRVRPYNPYNHRIRVAVRVYDADFMPVAARVSPPEMMLGSRDSRPVLVEVEFGSTKEKRVRICTESTPFPSHQTKIRAQICGRFIARRAD